MAAVWCLGPALALVVLALPAVAHAAGAAQPEAHPAFALRSSELLSADTPVAGSRFTLRADLTPAPEPPSGSTGRFALARTQLAPKGVAACGTSALFRDGFESP